MYVKVEFIRAKDGDTAILRIPLPFDLHIDLNMRLLGINTPEIRGPNHEAAVAATTYLTELLHGAEGLIVQTHSRDKYGRWLGEIWALRAGVWSNVNAAMLSAGHAVSYWP